MTQSGLRNQSPQLEVVNGPETHSESWKETQGGREWYMWGTDRRFATWSCHCLNPPAVGLGALSWDQGRKEVVKSEEMSL